MKIKKFESHVNKDGSFELNFNDKDYTELQKFIDQNESFFAKNGISHYVNEEDFVFQNEDGDLYLVEVDYVDGGYITSYDLANGQMGEQVHVDDIETIQHEMIETLLRGRSNVALVDLMAVNKDFMKNKHALASENEEEIVKEDKVLKLKEFKTLTTPEASHNVNKHYNWDSKPDSHRSDDKWYAYVYKHEIGIGEADPVAKFKEWSGKYWRPAGSETDKYEPNSGVSNKEKIKEGLSIDAQGNILEDERETFKIIARHKERSIGYEVVDHADSEEEAQERIQMWKDELGDSYDIKHDKETFEVDLNTPEGEQRFFDVLKKYGQFGKGTTSTSYSTRYDLPIEAKSDLDAIGLTWYTEERVTNPEHPDYGKKYIEVQWASPKSGLSK
jgi:hypothetical protein